MNQARVLALLPWVCVAIIAGIGLLARGVAHAHGCPSSFKQWSVASPGGAASAPVHDTGFPANPPGRFRTYFTQGSDLLTVYNQNFPPGCTPGAGNPCAPSGGTCLKVRGCKLASWTTPPPAAPINAPNAVPLSPSPPRSAIFLGADNGRLYKLDITGDPPYPTLEVDTRRPSCGADAVYGTPAVQLYSLSNQAFKDHVDGHSPGSLHDNDDLVYVITATACGDATRNRIIAYWASDLTKKWEFNAPRLPGEQSGPVRIGQGNEGCTLDYNNNQLYCGTAAAAGSAQDSLWAFDTLDGRLIWSDNPGGAILNRPTYNSTNDRLYVVSQPGALWAYDPAGDGFGGAAKLWTSGLAVASEGAEVVVSPWAESRAGTWQNKILVLDSAGTLRGVRDNGTAGSIEWDLEPTDPPAKWTSMPVVLPGAVQSKAFIGRNDGHLQMIKLDGGQVEGVIQIASTTSQQVSDPSTDTDPVSGDAVVVVGGSTVARVAVPICTADPGQGAAVCFDECFLPSGNPPNWDPYCVDPDTSCRTYSCRDPGWNLQYNPCRALAAPTTACVGNDPECFGGFGCTDQGWVADGTACDDAWPGVQDPPTQTGAATSRADAIPPLVACTLPEGTDCNYQTGLASPGSRSKCVTKPGVCGSVGGGKCCVCNDGYGAICNDRCHKGQCVSDLFAGVPCLQTGDQACTSGTTCCGSMQGPTCTSDLDCTSTSQGKCLDLNPLDADSTRRCYYQRCADLFGDAQHCGACATDCGEYGISADSCAGDADCGYCTSDAQCAALGGKCVDGACGRCRGDTSATAQPSCGISCITDVQCGGGVCTNGFCCAAGRECVGGTCFPLVCHRLVNRGTCVAGNCTAGAPCAGPDATDLADAGPPGMCSIEFEYTTETDGSSVCSAYVTNYRTDGGTALAKIDADGGSTAYPPSPADATRLHGVAVSSDGENLFAAMVSNLPGTPGLALREPGDMTYSSVKTAQLTGGVDDHPFDQAAFNTGPVGPAFDHVSGTPASSRKVWLGNFKCPGGDSSCTCLDFGLCRIDFANGTSWTAAPEPYCNQPCADTDGLCEYTAPCPGFPDRITALAFEQRRHAGTGDYHRYLIIAHGTTLSFLDLDGGTPRQTDVDLSRPSVCVPDPTRGGSTVEAILSIAPAPYGDVFVEVRGNGDQPAPGDVQNTWLLSVNPHDRSCRHALDVQRSMKHVNPCGAVCSNDLQCGEGVCTNGFCCAAGSACVDNVCMSECSFACAGGFTCVGSYCRLGPELPPNFGIGVGSDGGNGRLAMTPSGTLLRWIAAVDTAPTNLIEYDTTPYAFDCDDGDPCTTDSYSVTAGQCEHPPVDCNDLDACTADACEASTGICLHPPIVTAEPEPLAFNSTVSMQWAPSAGATHWNTYRGTIPATSMSSRPPGAEYDHVCFESADALGDGPTTSTDVAIPPVGTAFYYLVSGEAACGESGIGRSSAGAPIPNDAPCPTPP